MRFTSIFITAVLAITSFNLQAGGHDKEDPNDKSPVTEPGAVIGDAKIIVDITDVKVKEGGTMIVTLFKEKKTWLKNKKALRNKTIKVEEGANMKVTFDGLAPDADYAIQALHDANDNGKMDMKFFPIPKPKEGSGFSNGYTPSGFPKYDGAVIKLEGNLLETSIKIDGY